MTPTGLPEQEEPSMPSTRTCADCASVHPVNAFHKTRGGSGLSTRCRDCIDLRAEAHREEKMRHQESLEAELMEFVSAYPDRPIPHHLAVTFARWLRGPTAKRSTPLLSNRPQMALCAGCGDKVPKRHLWSYGRGRRGRYCPPCMKRRAVERECADCSETKLTSEFFAGLNGASRHCLHCREKRTLEKHCPRCKTTKPLSDFGQSRGRPLGWCKKCNVDAQRIRRTAARCVAS